MACGRVRHHYHAILALLTEMLPQSHREIDVFEGVNAMPTSQMGLHTTPGCVQTNPNQLTTLVNSTDCAGDNNAGCMLTNTHPSSYGTAFAAAQGGVFITEFAESGIS